MKGMSFLKQHTNRSIHGALSLSMIMQAASPILANQSTPQLGNIETNVIFMNNDSVEQVESRDILFSLLKIENGIETTIGSVNLNDNPKIIGNFPLKISYSNETFTFKIHDLPIGEYKIALDGKHHAHFLSDTIPLEISSKQLNIFTNSGDFTYGDLNQDGFVNEFDFKLLENAILSDDHSLDLTGDALVDIEDLAVVRLNMADTNSAIMFDTNFISMSSLVNTEEMNKAVDQQTEVNLQGDLGNLFNSTTTEAVILSLADESAEISEETPIEIPIILQNQVEMAQIELISPSNSNSIESGFVTVVYLDKNNQDAEMIVPIQQSTAQKSETLGISIENTAPKAEIQTLSSGNNQENVVVISLGARVVVKSITVTVTAVESPDGSTNYIALQEVNFVQDIVPEDPQASNGLVENIIAISGNESVKLSWDKVPNVSGYRVSYSTSSGKYSATLNTNATNLTISGLDNFTTYYFFVQSTHGDWSSSYSDQVVGKPEPSSAPSATTLLEASPMEHGATVKWQSNKNATGYQVWAKKTDSQEDYTLRATTSGTSILIGDLENDISYSIYVTCYNNVGSSGHSNILEVIPEKENLDGPIVPTTGRLPLSAVTNITMGNSDNVNMNLYPNGWYKYFVHDGNFATDWVADKWWYDTTFTFEFDQPYDMSYFVYVAKVAGLYHSSLTRINVSLWEENGGYVDNYTDSSIKTTDINGENLCIVDFPRTTVSKISVSGVQYNGSPTNVSLSEIIFYDHNGIDDEVAELFSNDSFTALKEEVTQEKIDELRVRVDEIGEYVVNSSILNSELDMAERILNKEETIGIVKTNLISIDKSKDDRGLSDISPLDFIAYSSTQLTVYADIPEGETITLIPSQYYAEAFDHIGSEIILESGRNIIDVPQLTNYSDVSKGGTLYYRYTGDKGDEITLHFDAWFKSSERQDLWKTPVLELYDMYDISESEVKRRIESYISDLEAFSENYINNPAYNPMNATEISLRNVLLSVPASEFYSGLANYGTSAEKAEALYQSILAWEELLMICNVVYGLDDYQNPRAGRQNIRYMRMSDAFMFAGGNHIGIQYGSVKSLSQGKPTSVTSENSANSLFGWGIAHEIGHNLDRMGRLEITNNIYSLLAQTWDGGLGYGDSRVSYGDVYNKVTSGNMGLSNNIFTQLAMYWQLQQGFCDENPLEFYHLINKEYKANSFSNYSNEERFALIVASVTNRNLLEFFTAWGVSFSESSIELLEKHQKEERLIQYFDDNSREYRLEDGTSLSEGNFSITAEADESSHKKVNLSIEHDLDEKQLLGFEIYRNGNLISFVTDTNYCDSLGYLNNTAIEYSVRAVDRNGNYYGDFAYAQEFRIEYDDVIDSSAYNVVEIDGGYKFTFHETTVTSGILIRNPPNSGDFQVYLADNEGYSLPNGETISTSRENHLLQTLQHEHDSFCDCPEDPTALYFSLRTLPMTQPSEEEMLLVKSGNFNQNDTISGDKFINFFQKQGVGEDDTRIATYDAKEIIVMGENLNPDDISFLNYIGDNVWFMENPIGVLAEDFSIGNGEIIPKGTIIVLGEYVGDPYFNEITLLGRFSDSNGIDGENVTFTERAFSGTTYMFGYATETVTTISDGLFIFVPDVQNEAELQGDFESCQTVSLFPDQMKLIMSRTSDTGTYETSNTTWLSTPSADTMPQVFLSD